MSKEKISKDKVVTVDFELRNAAGEMLDSSKEVGIPLAYLHGSGEIVPGLEVALEGRQEGDTFEVTLAPEDAFGEKEEAELIGIPKADFGDAEIETGMPLMLESEEGYAVTAWIDHVDEETAWADLNHPLAGETLTFNVEVVEVRDATAEELEHGHAHGSHDHECEH